MGEITTGVLYPCKYEAKVLQALSRSRQPFFHQIVNREWNAFFLQDEWIETAETLQFLLKLSSKNVPLLWFHDSEENGWGFRLFDGGCEVSSATISYTLEMELAEAEFVRLYPHIDVHEELPENEEVRCLFDEVLEKVVRSEQYRQEIRKGISRVRPQSFARFLGQKQVKQLCSLFDPHLLTEYDEETGGSLLYDSIDLFKEILGIEEMVWVNYSYLASGRRE